MTQPESIRQDVYSAIRTLLIANKPSYEYGGTTYEFTIVAEYGRQNASFPYVVLNPALIDVALLNLDGSGEDYEIELQLDLFALEKHRQVAIDSGADSIQNTIINNQTSLQTTNSLLLMQDPFDESNTTPFEDSSQVLNTKTLMIKMKLL